MDINLHLLNTSGTLSPFVKAIKKNFANSTNTISKRLSLSSVDVVVYDNPQGTIEELGIGGYTLNTNTLFISLDAKFPNLIKTIEKELKRTLAHELYHCKRLQIFGYWEHLLEAIVSEGLADHFDLEVNGGKPEPWSVALSKKQTNKLLQKAKKEFAKKKYDHNAWFFGSKEKGIPRWTGYSLGFFIVKNYLQKHPHGKPSILYATKAEEFT